MNRQKTGHMSSKIEKEAAIHLAPKRIFRIDRVKNEGKGNEGFLTLMPSSQDAKSVLPAIYYST
jgi:hypothetical protein